MRFLVLFYLSVCALLVNAQPLLNTRSYAIANAGSPPWAAKRIAVKPDAILPFLKKRMLFPETKQKKPNVEKKAVVYILTEEEEETNVYSPMAQLREAESEAMD